jgi:hypothetical protein
MQKHRTSLHSPLEQASADHMIKLPKIIKWTSSFVKIFLTGWNLLTHHNTSEIIMKNKNYDERDGLLNHWKSSTS